MMRKTRTEGFGKEVRRRIMLGTYVLSSGTTMLLQQGYAGPDLIRQDFANAFEKCDLLLTPTSPVVAYPLDGQVDPLTVYMLDVTTIP